jgi:hypothetical protein
LRRRWIPASRPHPLYSLQWFHPCHGRGFRQTPRIEKG